MTEDTGLPWPNPFDPEGVAEASEEVADTQQELIRQWTSMATNADATGHSLTDLSALCTTTATFKARVQSSGRISIPDAEREALDIQEGDIVQTVVVPVDHNRSDD